MAHSVKSISPSEPEGDLSRDRQPSLIANRKFCSKSRQQTKTQFRLQSIVLLSHNWSLANWFDDTHALLTTLSLAAIVDRLGHHTGLHWQDARSQMNQNPRPG